MLKRDDLCACANIVLVNTNRSPNVGDPEPEVEWSKDGELLKPRKKDKRLRIDWDIAEDMHLLELKDAREEDSGEYTFRALNVGGVSDTSAHVSVGKDNCGEGPVAGVAADQCQSSDEDSVATTVEVDVSREQSQGTPTDKPPLIEDLPPQLEVEIGGSFKLFCKISGQL